MAFDTATRAKLQAFVNAARKLLTDEFQSQLQQTFGIQPTGEMAAIKDLKNINDDERGIAQKLHERIEHLVAGLEGDKHARKTAVARVIREQAFTVLNRFVAIRLAEERDIIAKSCNAGFQSKSFRVYEQVAGTTIGNQYERYKTFMYCLYDELALDLGVLFDRYSPYGMLFPRQTALTALFELINSKDLASIYTEDETIGWVYQYYNDPAERKKMRDESAAPRNSRELAVRNQFFTPRYVVEFLTDNTLGRIWYEMTQGQTRLKEDCRYLVRRPNEIFLKPGETAPAQPQDDNLSQEELLKQPVHITHRPVKDPRTILLLDPACGSMHFGLYAFDLFEAIYEEAWELEAKHGAAALARDAGMQPLHESFADKESFLQQVPRLIVEYNLHGIDIDPRCAQIAGLSLWLRAQKSWQKSGLKALERPAIKRSNIVCAEPMPGEKDLLQDFVAREFPKDEQVIFKHLLEVIFDKMQLAGEAGSLLKIEEEITDAVETARLRWLKMQEQFQFTDSLSLAGDFWANVEDRLLKALRDYAEHAVGTGGFQRRLFAEDAAQGFAFIDVSRKRFDVVVMNPPFGDGSDAMKHLIFSQFDRERIELGGCYITRFRARLDTFGKLGIIANRTLLFAPSLATWRLTELRNTEAVIDLGHGVLDALVETFSLTLGHSEIAALFIQAIDEVNKGTATLSTLRDFSSGKNQEKVLRRVNEFESFFGAPFAYWAPASFMKKAIGMPPAETVGGIARQGLATCDNYRFLRLREEIPREHSGWEPLVKGGEYQPFWAEVPLRVKWGDSGAEVKAFIDNLHGQWSRVIQSTNLYGQPGATYSERTASSLSMRVLPRGCIFDKVGPFVGAENLIQSQEVALTLIGLSYTTVYRFLIETSIGLRDGTTSGSAARHYLPSMIQRLPWPVCTDEVSTRLLNATKNAISATRELNSFDEPSEYCHEPMPWNNFDSLAQYTKARQDRWCSILKQIYENAGVIESISMSIFDVDLSDIPDLELISGRSIFRYAKNQAIEHIELQRLMSLESDDLIKELVKAGKAHATIYKKSYWGDRNLELICHLWEIHPLSIIDAVTSIPPSERLRYDSAWKILSMTFAFAFEHILPSEYFKLTKNVLPEDLFAKPKITISSRNAIGDTYPEIYCDDETHPADIVKAIEKIQGQYFGQGFLDEIVISLADTAENLRSFIANHAFGKHLSQYTNFRRQAPIYWPLSTRSGGYTVWVYYHRLNDQTLHKILLDFVHPKIDETENVLGRLSKKAVKDLSADERKENEQLKDLLEELRDFKTEIERLIALPYRPNLNDGVEITAAPFYKLFRLPKWQNRLREAWGNLESGEYDWAHLAYAIWPERVKTKCKKDKSLAIAHGLEDLYVEPTPKAGKKKAKKAIEQPRLAGFDEDR